MLTKLKSALLTKSSPILAARVIGSDSAGKSSVYRGKSNTILRASILPIWERF